MAEGKSVRPCVLDLADYKPPEPIDEAQAENALRLCGEPWAMRYHMYMPKDNDVGKLPFLAVFTVLTTQGEK